ncbi:MAG: ATP-binding protein [Turicibacter sp.]|nr:ATP-binding protein [Turicibacter sp.]
MIENYVWLGILVFTCIADFVMMYFMAHNVTGRKLEHKWWHYAMMVGFGAIVAVIMYYGEDSAFFRFFGRVLVFITLKIVVERKILDILLIYIIIFPIIFFVHSLTLISLLLLELDRNSLFLLTQLLTLSIVVIVSKKFFFNRIFIIIKQSLALMIGSIVLLATLYGFFIATEFNLQTAFEHLLWFGLLGLITLASLLTVSTIAQAKIDYTSAKYHDLVNKFNGLFLTIEGSDDLERIRVMSRVMREYVTGRPVIEELTDDFEENFKKLMQDKLVESKKENELIVDLSYFGHHATVSTSDVTYMLGTLFDNALEHGLDKPIYVYLNVSHNIFELSVKNSCNAMTDKQLKKLFKKGFSSKEGFGHGQGLYNLNRDIEAFNDDRFTAKIKAECYYDLTHESNFLEITIDISSWEHD